MRTSSTTSTPTLVTVATHAELALATALVNGWRQHTPGGRAVVCVLDRPAAEIHPAAFPFELLYAESLGIENFLSLAFRQRPEELALAILPFLLQFLHEEGESSVLVLEVDSWITGPLDSIFGALANASVLCLPRFLNAFPPFQSPAAHALEHRGALDSGCFGLNLDRIPQDFLQAWTERCRKGIFWDPLRKILTNPQVDSLAAYLDDVVTLRDPRVGVNRWNFPLRSLDPASAPVLYRFEGIDRERLSADPPGQNRFKVDLPPAFAAVLQTWRGRVEKADHARFRSLPYGYGAFDLQNIPIPPAFRMALHRTDPLGLRWTDPFDVMAEDGYFAWLMGSLDVPRGRLNRAALALWEFDPGLISAYPDPGHEDLEAFVGALLQHQDSGYRSRTSHPVALPPEFIAGLKVHKDRTKPSPRFTMEPWETQLLTAPILFLENFDLSNPGALTPWLNSPVATAQASPVLTRLALLLHNQRGDLHRDYPHPLEDDQVDFAYWFATEGQREFGLHTDLVAPTRQSLQPKSRLSIFLRGIGEKRTGASLQEKKDKGTANEQRTLAPKKEAADSSLLSQGTERRAPRSVDPGESVPFGVNVAGYLQEDSGQGQVVRGQLKALERAEIPVARIPLDRNLDLQKRGTFVEQPEGTPFGISLFHVTALDSKKEMAKVSLTALIGSKRIAYWFWEMSYFPMIFANRFGWFDEIWAPSQFCFKAFEPLSSVPIRLVPPCVLPPLPQSLDHRARWGFDADRFYFLFCFDMISIPDRKNPLAAIRAFKQLRREIKKPVGLVLKITRADFNYDLMKKLQAEAEGEPVTFLTQAASREEMDSLLEASDCFLSLHRSEGLGLLPIESLYLEKPVIATAYGGVVDFLDASNSYPVDYRMVRLTEDRFPYPEGAVWAEPHLDSAVNAMRRVVENPEEARALAQAGRRRVESLYGEEAAAARLHREITRLTP